MACIQIMLNQCNIMIACIHELVSEWVGTACVVRGNQIAKVTMISTSFKILILMLLYAEGATETGA